MAQILLAFSKALQYGGSPAYLSREAMKGLGDAGKGDEQLTSVTVPLMWPQQFF